MNRAVSNLLGLDIGARQIGVAVFEGENLIFYAVKTIKKTNEAETIIRFETVLAKLVADYDIKIIALEEVVYLQQQRSFVKTVYEEAERFALERNLKVFQYNPNLIRQTICHNTISTKQQTFKILTERYAELRRYFFVPKSWQKIYYAYLFNAIAIGLVCLKEIKSNGNINNNLSRF